MNAVERADPPAITDDWLAGFDRSQRTTLVRRYKDATQSIEEDPFDEEWDDDARTAIARHLNDSASRGGIVLYVGQPRRISAFAAIEPGSFGPRSEYRRLSFLHVDASQRGRGLGRALFESAVKHARAEGVGALYIAAHPAIETQRFYDALGCRPARYVHAPIFLHEPLDIQLEYPLTT